MERILAALAERLGPLEGEPEPLDGGITNRNFRVQLGEEQYVLRLHGEGTELLAIDRAAERLAGEAAAALGLAPAVAAWGNDHLLTAYLEGQPSTPAELAADPAPAAETLRRFHGCGVRLPVLFWVPELLDRYAGVIRGRGGVLPEAYAPTCRLVDRIAEVLPLTSPLPCHNDLLPGNLIRVEDRVVLVDWEYAGMGHRYFDLANLAAGHELDDAAERTLLAAYLEREPREGDRAALKLMRVMSEAREAAWGAVQERISTLDFDFAAYAALHFQRALAADPDELEGWLDAAAA